MAVRGSVNGFSWADIVNSLNEVVVTSEPAFLNRKCPGGGRELDLADRGKGMDRGHPA